MKRQLKFTIGQRVWFFDDNRRIYETDQSGPIYSRHFVSQFVVGIEGRSYLINSGPVGSWANRKIAFDKAEKCYFTDQERSDDIWKNGHQCKVADLVRRCDLETLKRVAEVIGYVVDDAEPEPDEHPKGRA